ncbi:hypothetical protein IG193_03575 [Infirmifilum lucidum]|uniref:Uncharacterized protein n=1 Tax=Infirmifilum lucidum TaxID=2776706 RepID=A0A7L9FIG8_9CREN|nr:hypothetical protein [Infirmifilum lucidum]QOJ79549.1 hypothetical protein IG193_03575 [Infirmifilum lucidum]
MSLTPFERARKRAKLIKETIEDLDAIRAFKLFNPSRALRNLRELKLEGELWRELGDALTEIAQVPSRDKSFPRLKKIDSISDKLFIASFGLMVGSLILLLFNYEALISYLVLILSLIVLNISYLLKFYVSVKVRSVYMSNIGVVKAHGELMKRAVDSLVPRLRGELKKAGIEAGRVKLTLFHGDYTGLVIVEEKKGVYKLKLRE